MRKDRQISREAYMNPLPRKSDQGRKAHQTKPPSESDHGAGVCPWDPALAGRGQGAVGLQRHTEAQAGQSAHGLVDDTGAVALVMTRRAEFLICGWPETTT